MNKKVQISESIELGILLALSGGFMDAYSYMCRGKVFANAQTGNILLLGINISERNWHMALHYLKEIFLQLSATFALFLLLPLESHLQTLSEIQE